MRPSVGSSRFRIMREVVVLPQPDSPTSPKVSPALMSKETSSTALTCPSVRENRIPLVKAKCLRSYSTRSNGCSWCVIASTNTGQHRIGQPRHGLREVDQQCHHDQLQGDERPYADIHVPQSDLWRSD